MKTSPWPGEKKNFKLKLFIKGVFYKFNWPSTRHKKNLNTVLWWQGTHISFIGEKSITESWIPDFCTWIKGMPHKFVQNKQDPFNQNLTSQTIIMVQTL